jgi:hypothetical protein
MDLSHDLLGLLGWFGFESSWSGSWYAAGAKPMCMVWLQVGCLLALLVFGYRCDSYELVALGYSWVTLVQILA